MNVNVITDSLSFETSALDPASWSRLRRSCDACLTSKVKCSQDIPSCGRCRRLSAPCRYSPLRAVGRPRKRPCTTSTNESSRAYEERPARSRGAPNGEGQPTLISLDQHHQILPSDGSFGASGSVNNNTAGQVEFTMPGLWNPADELPSFIGGFSPVMQAHDLSYFLDQDVDLSSSLPAPVQPIQFQPDIISTLETTSTTQPQPQTRPKTDCRSKCFAALLQQMLSLRESLPETSQQYVDEVLHMMREMSMHQSQIRSCAKCSGNRSSLLLLAAVTERIVQMLDHIFDRKAQEDAQISPRPSHITLHVGCVKLDDGTRDPFLKTLLALRLKKLAAAMEELQRSIASRPTDPIYLASQLVLDHSVQRVGYLRGQIQLWRG